MFKDAITPFYERLKRPFIGAFWISFLGVNWRVWTALFFYDQQVGGLDKIQYIEAQLTFCNTVIRPLCYSIIFLIVAPQIDYLAFWYQLDVRKKKRVKQNKFESETPPQIETHLRVIKERDDAKATLLKKESKVQELEGELLGFRALQEEVQVLKFVPSISYFLGEWAISQPNIKNIYFLFYSTYIEIIEKREDGFNGSLLKIPIYQLKRTPQSIIIPLNNSDNSSFIEKFIQRVKQLNDPSGDQVRFTTLFNHDVILYEIHLMEIYKDTFRFNSNKMGNDITLIRTNPWDASNYLFEGEEGKKYVIRNA